MGQDVIAVVKFQRNTGYGSRKTRSGRGTPERGASFFRDLSLDNNVVVATMCTHSAQEREILRGNPPWNVSFIRNLYETVSVVT